MGLKLEPLPPRSAALVAMHRLPAMAGMGAPEVPAAVRPAERAEPAELHQAVLAAMSRSRATRPSHPDRKGLWLTRMVATRPAVTVGLAERALAVLAVLVVTVLLPVETAETRARLLRPSSQMTALVLPQFPVGARL